MQQNDKRGKLTKAEYARARGVHRSTISRQVRDGVIPVGRRGLIDPVKADAARAANLDPTRGRRVGSATASTNQSLSDARTRRENAVANLRELEFLTRAGSLVDVAEVDRLVGGMIIRARDRLLHIPGNLTTRLQLPAEVTTALDEEIRAALLELSNCRFAGEKTDEATEQN